MQLFEAIKVVHVLNVKVRKTTKLIAAVAMTQQSRKYTRYGTKLKCTVYIYMYKMFCTIFELVL